MSRKKLLARRPRTRRRRLGLLLAAAAVLTAAGIATAVAAGGSTRSAARRTAPRQSAYLARDTLAIVPAPQAPSTPAKVPARAGLPAWHGDVPLAAQYLGLDPRQVRRRLRAGSSLAAIAAATPGRSAAGLIEAIVAARERRLSAAAAAGKLKSKAEQRRLAQLPARVAAEVARPGGPAPRGGHGALSPAARYLDLTPLQLRVRLRGGHSLAQIAGATPGRSVAGLVAALEAAARARLEAAAAAGRISPQAEARRLAALPALVTARVNRVPRARAAHG